ncbi:LCP family protein [Streptomyces sp. JJ66]|uniref:LCP family protein n=1 Tax=Streptomyces sp. JJ66 TaxID=2803843 RepID=UPI0027E26389|nr:LCP family protein [Streptomyces sp. JJ66]
MPAAPRHARLRHPARRGSRWGLRISVLTAAGVLTVSGFGHAVVRSFTQDIRRVDAFAELGERPVAGRGTNFLVVGVDHRDQLTDQEKKAHRLGGAPCRCTDTMLLVHLSEHRDRASVVSLPRDTYTTIPPHADAASGTRHGTERIKLNAAYTHGGPGLTVETVERLTGVHIHHYLEIDFTSFVHTVDALGGVPVCTVKPLKDRHSGLDIPAGTSVLDGGEALAYVRARSVDGSADLGRMRRQQRFVASVVDRATRSGVLLNPAKFRDVTSAALSSVRADHAFGPEQLLALGQALRGLGPAATEFTTVPIKTSDHQVPGIGATVRWDDAAAGTLFGALRADRPLTDREPDAPPKRRALPVPVPPRNIRVQVDNGTPTAGLGHTADQELRATGFATTGVPGNAAERDVERTTIAYDPRWDRSARVLAAALPGAELVPAATQGPVMRVTLGTDFTGVTPVRPAAPTDSGDHTPRTGDEIVCP